MPKLVTILGLFCALSLVECERTKSQIYIDIEAIGACFRRLNATNQIGCSSSRKGHVGVVHYIEKKEDLNWLLTKGPHKPYVALMTDTMFNHDTMAQLRASGKVNGALVYYNETQQPEGFSADDTCPNNRYSLYSGVEKYKDCNKVKWNPRGEGLMFVDHGIPIIAVKTEANFTTIKEKCYNQFNKPDSTGEPRQFPLCAALVKDAMDAAKDTPTCIRRSNLVLNLNPDKFCDPLGDYNVFMTTRLLNNSEEIPKEGIVMAATKLDGLTLFDTIYPNVDGTASGFVTLLAAAYALSQHKATIEDPKNRPIMFSFFQGEMFDYIGSSRMAYDMVRNSFPWKMNPEDKGVRPINITDLSAWLEVSQVGLKDEEKIWMHSDPNSRNEKVKEMLKQMSDEAVIMGADVGQPPEDNPLPPASLQMFLKKHDIPGVLVAEHKAEFVNNYYNSRFDVASTIGINYPEGMSDEEKYDYVTPAAKHLAEVSTFIARSLYRLSTNESAPNNLKVEDLTMTRLLYCFTVDHNCTMVRETLFPKNLDKWADQEVNMYVGVSGRGAHLLTRMVQWLMAYWWGNVMPVPPGSDCSTLYKDDPYYNYYNMSGPSPGKYYENTTCIQSLVNLSLARSPAFDIPDYDWSSNEYSSWSESVWSKDAMKVQIFLLPDPALEVVTLCLGIVLFVISLILAYFLNQRAPLLFAPSTRGPFE